MLFGVGAGWNLEEMRNHGTDPGSRFGILRERVEAMKEIWTSEEAEYHGKHVDFGPIWAWPKPVRKPHPPVLVGGMSDGALDRVVAVGDEWMPNRVVSPEVLGGRIADLQRRAEEAGREPHPRAALRGEGRGARGPARARGGGRLRALLPAHRGRGRGRAPARRARGRGRRDTRRLSVGRLDELDLTLSLSKDEERERLEAAQTRLLELRLALGGKLPGYEGIGPPVAVVFEGWDASGKGGALKRLVEKLDPRHVRVAQFAAPTDDEKRHHFLWRFWPALPGWGGMTVFDRSWYGRVLVERVEGFATTEEWSRAYAEIVDFERSVWTEGTIMVKFWLHVSAEEQLRRFKEREEQPAQELEAHAGRLAQPGEAAAIRRGGGGHAGAHGPWGGAVAVGGGGVKAVRAGEGGGDGDCGD